MGRKGVFVSFVVPRGGGGIHGLCRLKGGLYRSSRNHYQIIQKLFIICNVMQKGNENSARSFSDRSFWKSLRVVDVRAFGSWISAPKCLFLQDFDRPDRSFGSGYPRE